MKAAFASSTSSYSRPMKYDVFISFIPEDSGSEFAFELAKALSDIGLRTFMDDEGFQIGDNLSHIHENVIPNSRFFVVVLTKFYMASKVHLTELANIVDSCIVEMERRVIPVFYDDLDSDLDQFYRFDGLFTTNSRFLKTGRLMKKCLTPIVGQGNPFTKQDKQKHLKEVQRLKAALGQIICLPGGIFVTEASRASHIVEKIVTKVLYSLQLKLVAPSRYEYLVGMSHRLHRMDKLLDLGSNDVRFVVIEGLGGIGKTTIAKIVYENVEPKLEYHSCFLRVSGHNLVSLQNELLFTLTKNYGIMIKNENHGAQLIKNENHGAQLIKNCLSSRKVFIVLDGVDEGRQVEKLVGSPYWFRPGSRVIITTRNRNVARQPKYKDKILDYNVESLDHESAFLLFCKHAFRSDEPPGENFMYLADEVVKRVEGHPSALITIGSYLYGKNIAMWEESLKSVDKIFFKNLFIDILKESYEGLDVDSQQIFLDLACFFNNGISVNRVIEILMGFGYSSPNTKIHFLADRNLIEISYERIQMHILIRSIGRGIACGEIATQQGKQSRIWLREDISRVFHEKNGLEHIQGIVMDMEEEELILEADAFTCMTQLKLLEMNHVQLYEDIQFLSNQLRLLNWSGYPSKYLPSTFQPPSLLELHLRNSKVMRLWEGKKEFICLKEIDVSGSKYLIETPDFSKVPNLQRLILRNCVRLCVVHPSINSLRRLVLVDMEGCVSVKSFPCNVIRCRSLETLILSNSGLECFPEIEGSMKSLTELHLDGTLINNLPLSFGHLSGLALLNLRDCTQLSSLPKVIRRLKSLQTLILNGCKKLHQIPLSLGKISSLKVFDIGGTFIDQVPHAISSLRNLETLNCERLSRNIWHSLNAFSGNVLPIRDLNLSDCKLEDEDIPDDLHCLSLLEILDLSKNCFVRLAESLGQLTNLKALYLNDCFKLQRQQLPNLPTSLQYVGGEISLDMLQNAEGFSRTTSSSSRPSNARLMEKVENLSDVITATENSSSHHGLEISANKMGKQISQSCHPKFEVSGKNLIGMNDQLKKVYGLLHLKRSNDVLFLGIFGIAGIGKTSFAEVVYTTIANEFESSCFLLISEKEHLVSLQQQLLSQLSLKEDIEIRDEDYGAQKIKDHVKSRKTLIVLDDVDEKRQVEKLVGSPDWFGEGSRVIITTRNRDILRQPNYKDKMQEYNVELPCHESAYLVLCKYAFGDDPPDKNELCNEIVEKVGRLPLALRIIGSFLHNKDVAIWKETLTMLCKVEEDFFGTISKKRNQEPYTMERILGTSCPTEEWDSFPKH